MKSRSLTLPEGQRELEQRGGEAVCAYVFAGVRLLVHHHRDEEPDQWVYNCYSLGIERRPILRWIGCFVLCNFGGDRPEAALVEALTGRER